VVEIEGQFRIVSGSKGSSNHDNNNTNTYRWLKRRRQTIPELQRILWNYRYAGPATICLKNKCTTCNPNKKSPDLTVKLFSTKKHHSKNLHQYRNHASDKYQNILWKHCIMFLIFSLHRTTHT